MNSLGYSWIKKCQSLLKTPLCRFSLLQLIRILGTQGIIYFIDITKEESFNESKDDLFEMLNSEIELDKTPILVVLNKIDLISDIKKIK